MGKPQRRFGKEFEAEAVRLVEVSGRTQREIAMDLGVGLSTLRRWLDKRLEHEIEALVAAQKRQEDLAAELKRLRRENEIFAAGTRDPEERPTDFFRHERKSMRFRLHRCGEEGIPRPASLQGSWRQSKSGYFAS